MAGVHNNGSQSNKNKMHKGGQGSYEHPQIDSFSKFGLVPGNAEKQHLS